MKPIIPTSTSAQVDAVEYCACGELRTYLCKHGRCKGCANCPDCETADRHAEQFLDREVR